MEKKPTQVGVVTHTYEKIGVAIIKFSKDVSVGQTVRLVGNERNFSQTVDSLQVDHKSVDRVKGGDEAGLKIDGKTKEGDRVYLED